MVQGKLYQMADPWQGTGDAPLKYFSLARERVKPVIPVAPPIVEDLPVTIPEPYEPPAPAPKKLEELEYDELRVIAAKYHLPLMIKKVKMIRLIKEAQLAEASKDLGV